MNILLTRAGRRDERSRAETVNKAKFGKHLLPGPGKGYPIQSSIVAEEGGGVKEGNRRKKGGKGSQTAHLSVFCLYLLHLRIQQLCKVPLLDDKILNGAPAQKRNESRATVVERDGSWDQRLLFS